MQPRTKRQKEVLDFITLYIENHGYEPSYQLIARRLGVNSKAGIAKHIKALENQGLINRRRVSGSFNLEIPNQDSAFDAVCKIDWLDAPSSVVFRENWENAPLFVPIFLLGYLAPEKICAFRVPDDSMIEKNIVEGDVALIERKTFVRDGDCIAAIVEQKRTVLNQYYRAGANIELRPTNEKFETTRLAADKIEIQGVFRGLLRPLL